MAWRDIFTDRSLIYSADMLSAFATIVAIAKICDPRDYNAGLGALAYVDNANSKGPLLMGHSDEPAIDNAGQFARAFARSPVAWVWIGRTLVLVS